MDFERWLNQIGKSQKTARNYSSAIAGSISEWANASGLIVDNLTDITSAKVFQKISDDIKNLPIFQERNTIGNGMYSAAINQYAAYLSDLSNEEVQEDIEEVFHNSEINKTEKTALVNARVGQGKYRRDLIEHWGCCALTGFTNVRFLIASHIKPWRESANQERLDPYNGLLLLPNLDKVFDLGFVTFDKKGKIIVSDHLDDADKIGVSLDMSLALTNEHQEYIKFHRDVVFERDI